MKNIYSFLFIGIILSSLCTSCNLKPNNNLSNKIPSDSITTANTDLKMFNIQGNVICFIEEHYDCDEDGHFEDKDYSFSTRYEFSTSGTLLRICNDYIEEFNYKTDKVQRNELNQITNITSQLYNSTYCYNSQGRIVSTREDIFDEITCTLTTTNTYNQNGDLTNSTIYGIVDGTNYQLTRDYTIIQRDKQNNWTLCICQTIKDEEIHFDAIKRTIYYVGDEVPEIK